MVFTGLRWRLILPVLLAAGPATLLVVLTARSWREHELADAAATADQVGRHIAAVHARSLSQAQRTLAAVAGVLSTLDGPAFDRERQDVLRAAVEDHALFDVVGVIGGDGGIEYPPTLDANMERGLRAVSRAAATSDRGAITYETNPSSGRVAALLAIPEAGRRIAFATVELPWLHDATCLDVLPPGTVVTVFDRTARVLSRLSQAADPAAAPVDAAVVRVTLASRGDDPTSTEAVRRADQRGLSAAPESLFMTIAMSRAAVTAQADRLLAWTALGLLVSCLVAGAVAWISSDRLARHVNALVVTTMRLADGDSTARVVAGGSVPELDRLATSLDALASRSEHREREVALIHDHTLQKLSSALAQTADSVFITDRGGVIEYVNLAFEEMTGYSRDEAIGQTPRLFASGLHDPKFYEGLWATILSGQVFRTVVTNKRKDGRLFNEDQSITPIRSPAGVITHFVSTGRDITERKRIEAALRRLNVALEDEAARIASVLHDEAGQFLSSAHITLADVARELGPEQRTRVQQVRHHLDLAEEQLRRVSHELHPRILDDLGLTEAVRFLASGFGRRTGISVDVQVAVASFCPRTVETVCYRLVQEGLANIGKHARATRVSIAITHQRTEMVCSIQDDGVGFDVASVVEERDGFSLGLTLMRDRIEAVGGTLTILSEPQRGTELRATVPLEV